MLCVDVNVLVCAFRADAAHHAAAVTWLDGAQRGSEPLVILPEVAAGMLRVISNPRIWPEPSPSHEAMTALDDLLASPVVTVREAPSGRWPRFVSLVSSLQLSGNDVPDALLAAAAMELGATFVTFDRGFGRFEGLRLRML